MEVKNSAKARKAFENKLKSMIPYLEGCSHPGYFDIHQARPGFQTSSVQVWVHGTPWARVHRLAILDSWILIHPEKQTPEIIISQRLPEKVLGYIGIDNDRYVHLKP